MKGIILAGGSGTRLLPMTAVISKQLLPIYDKPMIFYPLSTLMLAGIRDVLIISTPEDTHRFEKLFGDGQRWGMSIKYAVQPTPEGIAQAFIIGEDFIGQSPCALILGDNLFFGNDLQAHLKSAAETIDGAILFGYSVKDPCRYGVAEFDENRDIIGIEEKPSHPKSNIAITGLYFYDNTVVEIAKSIEPSARGELEISAVNNVYLDNKKVRLTEFGRGMAWLDAGTPDSLMEAGEYVKVLQNRQGLVMACPEEIAWRNSWISRDQLKFLANQYGNSQFRSYLLALR
tara:strand:+ start:5018 stop:5878 length:861 start_codon:yes stop_codon:yes gene_type:complete